MKIVKIRLDFVTNSSSSSFLVALKGEFTKKQKNAIADYIIEKILGDKILEPGATEKEIQAASDEYYKVEDNIDEIKQALSEGKSIYTGDVVYEPDVNQYSDILEEIWSILEDNDNFEVIDDDLSI